MDPATESREVAAEANDTALDDLHELPRVASGFRLTLAFTVFVAALLASLLALVFVLVSHIFDNLTPTIQSDLEWKTRRGAAELARSAEYGIALRDTEIIGRSLQPYDSDSDVQSVVIVDPSGTLIVARGKPPVPIAAMFAGPPLDLRFSNECYLSWAESVIEGGVIGRVSVAVSAQRIHSGTRLKRQILVAFGVGTLLALVVTFAFVGFYVDPLIRVTRQAFARLEDTTRAALQATRLKTEFIANVSHEIRTPMNGMLGMIELLRRTKLSVVQSKYASTLLSSANALMAVLNDVLDFSKIEAGKLQLRAVNFRPSALVTEVIELFQIPAELKNLQLSSFVAADVPPVLRGDRERLRQVLSNFVGNAIKFTETGQVTLNVFAAARADTHCELRFEVLDTGAGISQHAVPQLFEAFSQVDGSLTRRQGGTGLGLAICRTLAQLMSGTVGVESQVGEGSRFWLRVPLELVALDTESSAQIMVAQPVLSRPEVEYGYDVLVVDDNPVNCEIIGEMLIAFGCKFDAVGDGYQALEAIKQHEYAIILMDCQMPGLDGYETTRRIRADSVGKRRLPILAVTAHAFASERERALAAGMDDYLTKPFTLAELSAALNRCGPSIDRKARPIGPISQSTRPLVRENEITQSTSVIGVFLTHVPGQLEHIGQAIRLADFGELSVAVHKLKGSCTMFGATKMAELCFELEKGNHDLDILYSALLNEFDNVATELRQPRPVGATPKVSA